MADENKQPGPARLVAALFLSVCLPAIGSLAFQQEISRKPWLMLGILLAYELIVGLLLFFVNVFSKLGEKSAQALAEAIAREWMMLWRFPAKHLRRHTVYRHRHVDVQGLGTRGQFAHELQNVYVNLTVVSAAPHRASANPVSYKSDASAARRHLIWWFLSTRKRGPVRLAILGPPGSGKTTLLRHVALVLATKRALLRGSKIPFFMHLREHASNICEREVVGLDEVLAKDLLKHRCAVSQYWIERKLARGHAIVLLDGLDEVADNATRLIVSQWVDRQVARYSFSSFILTSRPFGYRSNPLNEFDQLVVNPLTWKQVRKFVSNWYMADAIRSTDKPDQGTWDAAQSGAEELLSRMRLNSGLVELAANPLLLTMITSIHCYRSSLPEHRQGLYSEICDVFLGRRDEIKRIALNLSHVQKQNVLGPLALNMMHTRTRDVSAEDAISIISTPLGQVNPRVSADAFLKDVEDGSGILLERELGVYTFCHQTFQEYLAARYIAQSGRISELLPLTGDPWWHECFRLYCAMVTDATPVVKACLENRACYPETLILAAECVEEAAAVSEDVRAAVGNLLNEGVDSLYEDIQLAASQMLLGLRMRRMAIGPGDIWTNDTYLSWAEFRIFVKDQDDVTQQFFGLLQGSSSNLRPAVGLSRRVAKQLCTWLDRRAVGSWSHELPDSFTYHDQDRGAGHGYWTTSGFVRKGIEAPLLPPGVLGARVAKDLLCIDQETLRLLNHGIEPIAARSQFASVRLALEKIRSDNSPTFEAGFLKVVDEMQDLFATTDSYYRRNSRHWASLRHGVVVDEAHLVKYLLGHLRRLDHVDVDDLMEETDYLFSAAASRNDINTQVTREKMQTGLEYLIDPLNRWMVRALLLHILELHRADYLDCVQLYVRHAVLEERLQGTVNGCEGFKFVRKSVS